MNNDNITPAKVSRGVNAGQRNVLTRQPGNLRPTPPSPKPPTMKDDSISPNPQDTDGDIDSSVKVYADISTLAMQGVLPQVGDKVNLSVMGRVDSVDGGVVCVIPETVNGKPAPEAPDADDTQGDSMSSQRDALYANAQALDRGPSSY